jgi:hypothetical protein
MENNLTEAAFVELYGETPVKLGGPDRPPLPLRTALEMEAAFCPADESQRSDPAERLHYLANLIGKDTLHPEHRHLLAQDSPDES